MKTRYAVPVLFAVLATLLLVCNAHALSVKLLSESYSVEGELNEVWIHEETAETISYYYNYMVSDGNPVTGAQYSPRFPNPAWTSHPFGGWSASQQFSLDVFSWTPVEGTITDGLYLLDVANFSAEASAAWSFLVEDPGVQVLDFSYFYSVEYESEKIGEFTVLRNGVEWYSEEILAQAWQDTNEDRSITINNEAGDVWSVEMNLDVKAWDSALKQASLSVDLQPVPEPSALILMSSAVGLLIGLGRRRAC